MAMGKNQTCLMCTERQYPPSEVAQILDSAVRSLQPSCPQNLGVYRDTNVYGKNQNLDISTCTYSKLTHFFTVCVNAKHNSPFL
ncbi:hypothetical protein LguiA_007673 [Lonicera macranthoides]